MNEKGQSMILGKVNYAIQFALGAVILTAILLPLTVILQNPATGLANTSIFYMGNLALMLIEIIALVFVVVGLIGLFSPQQPEYAPPMRY